MDTKKRELLRLIADLRERYKAAVPPPCPVCGHARDSISAIGMGITYRCGSDAADPMGKSEDKRPAAWQHFRDSEFETSRVGDSDVLKLCDAMQSQFDQRGCDLLAAAQKENNDG